MKKFTVMPQLETPIGSIFLSLNGKSIPFYALRYQPETEWHLLSFHGMTRQMPINPVDAFLIKIETKDLAFGEWYELRFSGCADERPKDETGDRPLVFSAEGCFLGLSVFDPDKEEKNRQLSAYRHMIHDPVKAIYAQPFSFDFSRLHGVFVEQNDTDDGFVLNLLDRSRPYLFFRAAWTFANGLPSMHYESAVENWVHR
ncbi:MAG: hypothetical protein E7332_00110 [Clostridiales bacterium]|nr:hypothetical protein [Clostridiales bacterium]